MQNKFQKDPYVILKYLFSVSPYTQKQHFSKPMCQLHHQLPLQVPIIESNKSQPSENHKLNNNSNEKYN